MFVSAQVPEYVQKNYDIFIGVEIAFLSVFLFVTLGMEP
jgi:hypothetical protein